jgi:hypothetical protein
MPAPRKPQKNGVCKLTGLPGRYVNSHIIPAALTRLPAEGKKIVEAGIGRGVKKRFVSWYDNELVIRVGEDILESIDTAGIEVLREHKLVWSSWETDEELKIDELDQRGEEASMRLARISRARELQLFFLSLLWRSAASTRPEFAEVTLPPDILEDLRFRIYRKDPGAFSDFPVQLFQISSKGILHNRTPRLEKTVAHIEGEETLVLEYVRFYFDGLVTRIYLGSNGNWDDRLIQTSLRSQADTIIFTNRFEASRSLSDIKEMVGTVAAEQATAPSTLKPLVEALRVGWKDQQ